MIGYCHEGVPGGECNFEVEVGESESTVLGERHTWSILGISTSDVMITGTWVGIAAKFSLMSLVLCRMKVPQRIVMKPHNAVTMSDMFCESHSWKLSKHFRQQTWLKQIIFLVQICLLRKRVMKCSTYEVLT